MLRIVAAKSSAGSFRPGHGAAPDSAPDVTADFALPKTPVGPAGQRGGSRAVARGERPLAGRSVAVVGGATAGAEVAGALARDGALVVVFEQNARPYGKIEGGLPRWHVGLRRKECQAIDAGLTEEGVEFVPSTRVGRDVELAALSRDFHAVVLANGAWRDRPLPVPGAEDYIGRGVEYQNPFMIDYNRREPDAAPGARGVYPDGALVVGGGLASIDVVKVLMLETTRAALAERGIEVPLLELEVKGIPKVLARHGLGLAELGLRGATLFFRGEREDMPIVEFPAGADAPRRAKVLAARRRLIEKAIEKYRFRVETGLIPEELVVEGDRAVGLRLRRTETAADGRIVLRDEVVTRRGAWIVSSIGSLPEPIPGVAMRGELYDFCDRRRGHLGNFPNVFAAGNVATGRGNVAASRRHGAFIAEQVAGAFLGVAGGDRAAAAELPELEGERADDAARRVRAYLARCTPLGADGREALLRPVRTRQAELGYRGSYRDWIASPSPSGSGAQRSGAQRR